MKSTIPLPFQKRLLEHFDQDVTERVLEALEEPPSVSIRLNPHKPSYHFTNTIPVPWSTQGLLLAERPNFALDPLFHAGCYYVQDSSSMILQAVLERLPLSSEGILALDACAAPGGKSLILSDFLHERGFLIANEVHPKRNAILGENLLKWGALNQGVTQLSSAALAKCGPVFDLIVVDAPCSGEGMFRKDDFARQQWSEELVDQCENAQRSILDDLTGCLKPGGILVYSTCTLNSQENEKQIARLLEEGFHIVTPQLNYPDQVIPAEIDNQLGGYYLLPGFSTGEGLFVSALQKAGGSGAGKNRSPLKLSDMQTEAIDSWYSGDLITHSWQKGSEVFGVNDPFRLHQHLPAHMAFRSMGVALFEPKGKSVVPLHGLAMLPETEPTINLNLEDALNYLRKQSTSAASTEAKGWLRVGYEGQSLGWVKAVPGRWNNYYPNHFRLRT